MQTAQDAPPPPPQPSQVTITTVGPNGKTQTIEAAPPGAPVAIDPALAPVAIVEHPNWWLTEKAISLGMIGTFIVLLPMSIAMAIRMIRKPIRGQNEMSPGVDARLTRLEQSIDAIAIEMERVSEGQRYVTRLLASDKVVS
jgi:hypothetical protein